MKCVFFAVLTKVAVITVTELQYTAIVTQIIQSTSAYNHNVTQVLGVPVKQFNEPNL